MFEQAVRMKLRFNYRGQISVEDLWDLPVEVLDNIYSGLMSEQKASSEDSLLCRTTRESQTRNLQIGLVKHIVETKLAEQEVKKVRVQNKMQKNKIAAIIQKKQDEGLESMSVEDLQKVMKALDA